jgi:hypothetical protein
MRRGGFVFVAWAVATACGSFGSSSTDGTTTDGGSDAASDAIAPSDAGPYREGTVIECPQNEGGPCRLPTFCCARETAQDICASDGCNAQGEARINCRDDTACQPGYLCCVHLDGYNLSATTCEPKCHRDDDAGTFHVCGNLGATVGCGGPDCVALDGPFGIGGKPMPNPYLNVCKQ